MKIGIRSLLSIVIAVLALVYGSLDYSGTIDRFRGREAALGLWERLSTVPSGDSVMIFAGEPDFNDGILFIIANTRNESVRKAKAQGIPAAVIARFGGISRPPGTEGFPPNDSMVRFYAAPSSPIGIGYDYTREDRDSGWGYSLGSLGEIPQWVDESRSQERFIVYTLFIGLLSIVVAIQEAIPSKPSKGTNGGVSLMSKSTISHSREVLGREDREPTKKDGLPQDPAK